MASEISISKMDQRRLIRQKLRHKRKIVFGIWAIAFAYLSFTAESAPHPSDELDTMPLSRNLRFAPGMMLKSSLLRADGDSVNSDFDPGDFEPIDLNCTPPAIEDFPPDLFTQAERQSGAVMFHFFISAYLFFAIALSCDDYFVPSIECICDELHLPSDVAGATFMAIATSAPELFTNVIGTFITEGDIGVGTIVGSAVFNILAVCACCALAAEKAVPLEWWPLTRDCLFYSLSVILLIIVLINRQVFWYEALILVLFYGVYIFVMYYNTACKRAAEKFVYGISGRGKSVSRRGSSTSTTSNRHRKYSNLSGKKVSFMGSDGDTEKTPLIVDDSDSPSIYDRTNQQQHPTEFTSYQNQNTLKVDNEDVEDELELSAEIRDEMLISKVLYQSEVHAEEEKVEWGLFSVPFGQGPVTWFEWIVGWPARFCLTMTIPDCREHRLRKWYPLTFLMCIVWIATLSYVVSWMMTVIGHTLRIPDSVMGLTFIAAGTSVPEAVSSIIVTRQGLGSMGISNSIGSNTFDILICLGLPWLIRGALIAQKEVNYVQINSGGLEWSTILLMVSLFLLYTMLACNGFLLDRKVGFIALSMYAAFLVISSLFELNVFYQVNLPTCEST